MPLISSSTDPMIMQTIVTVIVKPLDFLFTTNVSLIGRGPAILQGCLLPRTTDHAMILNVE